MNGTAVLEMKKVNVCDVAVDTGATGVEKKMDPVVNTMKEMAKAYDKAFESYQKAEMPTSDGFGPEFSYNGVPYQSGNTFRLTGYGV